VFGVCKKGETKDRWQVPVCVYPKVKADKRRFRGRYCNGKKTSWTRGERVRKARVTKLNKTQILFTEIWIMREEK